MNTGRLFALAWRVAGRLPEPVVRSAFMLAADAAWAMHGKGVRQLERNLSRVKPDASAGQVRRLARRGMRSYMRYYGEAFTLPKLSERQIRARFRAVNSAEARAEFAADRAVIGALGHIGNWDMAGAWATYDLAPVTTVAEHLQPEELAQQFLAYRSALGMHIIVLDSGSEVFRDLLRAAKSRRGLVPLLVDRDLTASGVEVAFFGERARLAPGAAALALATSSRLYPITTHYERLRGARRRAAGSPWGLVGVFHDPIEPPEGGTKPQKIAAMVQGYADALAAAIAAHPADWHMLQKVFVTDLDPATDAAIRAAKTRGEG